LYRADRTAFHQQRSAPEAQDTVQRFSWIDLALSRRAFDAARYRAGVAEQVGDARCWRADDLPDARGSGANSQFGRDASYKYGYLID
jgi:hypothetical protein